MNANKEPDFSSPHQPPHGFQTLHPWTIWMRRLAVALWTGFLGAALLLLGFLMAWDHLWPLSDAPEFLTLAAIFSMAWLANSVTALMAQTLATAPSAPFSPESLGPDDE